MKDFRSETFIQFILYRKPVWFLQLFWVLAFVFLMILFWENHNNNYYIFDDLSLFIIIAFIFQSGFVYWITYRMYHLGRIAFLELKDKDLRIITDVSVYIKGFDLFSKKSFFNIGFDMPIYDFDKADIFFSDGSMILLGKTKQFGSTGFASPVEIATSNPLTTIANSKLINWQENKERIQIEINDSNYYKPIKIEFKNHCEEIKHWLIAYSLKDNTAF